VVAASKLVAEQMTEDEKNEFGAEIIEQHLSERKKPN
jgi:hypothetical protein